MKREDIKKVLEHHSVAIENVNGILWPEENEELIDDLIETFEGVFSSPQEAENLIKEVEPLFKKLK